MPGIDPVEQDKIDFASDKSNMKKVLQEFPDQIKQAYGMGINIHLKGVPDKIIICGMGGSSISGQMLDSYLKTQKFKIPVINVQTYDIPLFSDKNSLFIINSYSGNTEETVSCLRQCMRITNNIIIIATGGKLIDMAVAHRIPYVQIPKGLQPRNAIAYLFFPLLRILEDNGLIETQSAFVNSLINSLTRNITAYDSQAQSLARQLVGKMPIVYSSDILFPVAYRWKSEFNENSKILSFCNRFPELDHNELLGFYNNKALGNPFHIILLKDEYDHKRILKRMTITKNLIKGMNPNATFTELSIKGPDALTRIFTTIHLGDMASYYLALEYSTDPTPVDIIEKLKNQIGPFI